MSRSAQPGIRGYPDELTSCFPSTHILSTIGGLATIRAFGWTGAEIKRSHALLDTAQKPSYLLGVTQQWLLLVVNMAMVVLAVLLVSLATVLHLGSGTIGVGLVTLITFARNAADAIRAYTMVEIALGAVGRLDAFCKGTPRETRAQVGESRAVSGVDEGWPTKGAVEMDAVSARYGSAPDAPLALDGVSMSVAAGEKIAICGRTGRYAFCFSFFLPPIILLCIFTNPLSARYGTVFFLTRDHRV